ncbi:hypothetical protein FJ661_12250 [Pseudarthrobacter phenanthrenivorans]|uniref:hypothetical protein n=1 Tax=Pseudarthrobacter phenanthrenivorans TaxID=361575 RepID=UPI00112BDE5D|nr:hypothetical protein [Pseudarthrobacter phenanthrenivorans]TPV50073.1 hypothetical protein FJ661_12250 [Pseudarthrobacter phenanthrenivorans]
MITGDGVLDDKMVVNISKDEHPLDNGLLNAVVWHFFPSARSNLVGPTLARLDEMKVRGVKAKVHLL